MSNLAEAELWAPDTTRDPPPPPAGSWRDRHAAEVAKTKREHAARLATVRMRLSWAPSGIRYDVLRDRLIRDDDRWTTGVPEVLRELASAGEAHSRNGLWFPGPTPTPTTPNPEDAVQTRRPAEPRATALARTLDVLQQHPGGVSVADIARDLPGVTYITVRQSLYALRASGQARWNGLPRTSSRWFPVLDSSSPSPEGLAPGGARADDLVDTDTDNHEVSMTDDEAGAGGPGATEDASPLVADLVDELPPPSVAPVGDPPAQGPDESTSRVPATDGGLVAVDPVVEEEAATAVLAEIAAEAAAVEEARPQPPPVPVWQPTEEAALQELHATSAALVENLPHEVPPMPAAIAPDPFATLVREAFDRLDGIDERLGAMEDTPVAELLSADVADRLDAIERRMAPAEPDVFSSTLRQVERIRELEQELADAQDTIDDLDRAAVRERAEQLEDVDRLLGDLGVPEHASRRWRLGWAACKVRRVL